MVPTCSARDYCGARQVATAGYASKSVSSVGYRIWVRVTTIGINRDWN